MLLLALDIRTAFNSERCADILGRLENFFHTLELSLSTCRYCGTRIEIWETASCSIRDSRAKVGWRLYPRVVQDTILGLDPWNPSYDNLLRFNISEYSLLVGCADDVMALISGRTDKQAQTDLVYWYHISQSMTFHSFRLTLGTFSFCGKWEVFHQEVHAATGSLPPRQRYQKDDEGRWAILSFTFESALLWKRLGSAGGRTN